MSLYSSELSLSHVAAALVVIVVSTIIFYYVAQPRTIAQPFSESAADSGEPASAFVRGIRAFQSKQTDEAIREFNSVLAGEPRQPDALLYRAACYFHLKDKEKALRDFRLLTEIEPTSAKYQAALGDCYLNLIDDLPLAEQCYNQCLRLDDRFSAAYYNRGMCRYRVGQYQAALADVERALAIEPNNWNYRQGFDELQQKLAKHGAQQEAVLASEADAKRVFSEAVERINSANLKLEQAQQLELYGLYKRVTVGECNAPRPSMFAMAETAKWNAWKKVDKLSFSQACLAYKQLADQLCSTMPQASDADRKRAAALAGSGGMAPTVSRPLRNDDDDDNNDSSNNKANDVFQCAARGDLLQMKQLLGSDVDRADESGMTPLMWAVDANQIEMIVHLIAAGADINAQDNEGLSALHYAAMCAHREALDILLKQPNCDKGLKTNEQELAVDYCDDDELAKLFS